MKFSASDLHHLIPEWYGDENVEINALVDSYTSVFQETAQLTQKVQDSSLITLCDENTLELYEQMFRIVPFPNDTLDHRRERVLLKLRLRRPFTLDFAVRQADALIGHGNYEITMEYPNYNFILEYYEDVPTKWMAEMNKLVIMILPANLIFTIKLNVSDNLALVEKSTLDVVNVKYFRVCSDDMTIDTGTRVGDPLESYDNQREEAIVDD